MFLGGVGGQDPVKDIRFPLREIKREVAASHLIFAILHM